MSFSGNNCFECNHPREDHPLMILTNGILTYDAYRRDGMMEASKEGTRIVVAGRSWKFENGCQEFVGVKQLELF